MPRGHRGFIILTQKERGKRNALSPFRRFSFYAVMLRFGTGGCGAPPSATNVGPDGLNAAPGGTGGCGAPPSATNVDPAVLSVAPGGTGGCGAPPSVTKFGPVGLCAALGTGGCGAPPSEHNLLPCCVIEHKIVEQPRSEALTNRIEHETLLKVMVFS